MRKGEYGRELQGNWRTGRDNSRDNFWGEGCRAEDVQSVRTGGRIVARTWEKDSKDVGCKWGRQGKTEKRWGMDGTERKVLVRRLAVSLIPCISAYKR